MFSNSKNAYEKPTIDYKLRKEVIPDGQTLGLGCIEGAFLCHAVPCPIDINNKAYIPLMLFMQYLTQLEGPFWRQIRGQGLAYGYNMFIRLNEQLLYFTLYRATNVKSAFKQFKSITVSKFCFFLFFFYFRKKNNRQNIYFESTGSTVVS